MERMLTEENFIMAERIMAKNKPDNRRARRIGENAEAYGKRLFEKIKSGNYKWHKPKDSYIKDSYKGKERHLKIPCLEDQAAQLAWLNIAVPYIQRRNYYFNCGSIPYAGQTRSVKALKKWLKNPRIKYGAVTDIRKFYDTCPHDAVRKGLERIFKDKAFIDYAMGFVKSMSDDAVGLAIGFPSSHWLANVALMELDHDLNRLFPEVKFTRYMDDIGLVSSNKRKLKRAVRFIRDSIISQGMRLKKWQVFKVYDRGLSFLSYRFFNGYTLLTKPLMVRISRRMRKADVRMSGHVAAGIISYFGLMKHCNSFNFRKNRVYPYVDFKVCRKLVKMKSRKKAA